ncbi:MAG: AAA family ATPase [Proteobacteria bacterium]|nr:AAA family ATPase [Pseudomonadota bacterium]
MAFTGSARFQLRAKLGEGGMGIVYDAYDRSRSMSVALKTLRRVSAANLYRFKREFRALSGLSHPNIIALYELISDGDDWFLTMERVDGVDFFRYVKNGSNQPGGVQLTTLEEGTTTTLDAPPTLLDSRVGAVADSSGQIQDGRPKPPRKRPRFAECADEDRIRSALRQLASALHVLHSAGIVHRDLKPDNVRITAEGRLVLMDFGVIAEMYHSVSPAWLKQTVGTPAFMAPEQAVGAEITAAADWYAFGGMLYLALTGRLPFEGAYHQAMQAKQNRDPLPPSRFATGIPDDLEQLCMGLLVRDPARRFKSNDVLACLGVQARDLRQWTETPDADRDAFVGRTAELRALRHGYGEADIGGGRCVFVRGLSGIGKTSLVERFTYELEKAGVTVLSARCHELEEVPYKAFDSIVDGLVDWLLDLPPALRRAIVGPDMESLARLFPVMRRVGPWAKARLSGHGDPVEVRSRAITALYRLLAVLSRERAVVLRIDDIQWADQDSIDLLARLLASPVPDKLMVVATLRTEGGTGPTGSLAALADDLERRDILRWIDLGPLSPDEQRELFWRLSDGQRSLDEQDDRLWRGSGGHPMLLTELARHAAELPRHAAELPRTLTIERTPTIEGVLWQRIAGLSCKTRNLLEVVAAAGQPLPLQVLGDAAGLTDSERERAAAILRIGHLVRTSRSDNDGRWLDAYHAKVRETVVARVPKTNLAALHRELAVALDNWDHASAALRARLWLTAGEPVRAARYLVESAGHAMDQLAADRAVDLYSSVTLLLRTRAGQRDADELRIQAWLGLADVLRMTGRDDDVLPLLDEAEDVASSSQMLEALAAIHSTRGTVLFAKHDVDGYLSEHQRALDCARRAGSPIREARSLSALGNALWLRGQLRSAHHYFDRCISLAEDNDLESIRVANLPMRGATHYHRSDIDAALSDCLEGAEAAAGLGLHHAELMARHWLAVLYLESADFRSARSELARALTLARKIGARRFEPDLWALRGRLRAVCGQSDVGGEMAQRSLELCEETGFRNAMPSLLGVLACVTDDAEQRRETLDRGERIAQGMATGYGHLRFYRDAMDAAFALGDAERLLRYAEKLDASCAAEPTPWSEFFTERGRALAAHLRDPQGCGTRVELRRLRDVARQRKLYLAANELSAALGEGTTTCIHDVSHPDRGARPCNQSKAAPPEECEDGEVPSYPQSTVELTSTFDGDASPCTDVASDQDQPTIVGCQLERRLTADRT